ncbi:hypothetical protein BT63DRAFT_248227 [Microthyrium microscopicum]|uniref:Wbp11/ELF5/Saf1 N-terminal domain-containing protein n=1 Tax=Microthyrium microscopicum TaxID=703497 RepID=A0A6A6UC26_9PEZI|nr:hypothetical protein BT63DRAFT_248227 [Microthyrium microscopicum]
MAKGKERSVNPATAALKADKKKSIKKQKTQLAAQRAEKLARRNPDRVQRQIDSLIEQRDANGGALKAHEKRQLEELERDVLRIRKAREVAGVPDKPEREEREDRRYGGDDRRDRGVLGKRGRGGERRQRSRTPESETDEDVRDIPMPGDVENMPPIPRKRRPGNPNFEPIPGRGKVVVPVQPAQTTYSSAPQIRDLHKEAVSRFVPTVVASKMAAVRGEGGKLLEPEEADRLEQAGYSAVPASRVAEKAADEAEKETVQRLMAREMKEGPAVDLDEEARRFEEEVRAVEQDGVTDTEMAADQVEQGTKRVEIEEVSDEDM